MTRAKDLGKIIKPLEKSARNAVVEMNRIDVDGFGGILEDETKLILGDTDKESVSEIKLSSQDVTPLTARERSSIDAATTAIQTAFNAVQRQGWANLRLLVNNKISADETSDKSAKDSMARFAKNPATVFSGVSHRFILQGLTQGLPMYYNRINEKEGAQPKISNSMTALWMTTIGCFFEVSGFIKPITEKAQSEGIDISRIDVIKRAPNIAMATVPLALFRNNIYANVVFGNKDDTLDKKVMKAGVAAFLTNPVDSAINIMAYEAGIAKDGTPLTEIYRNTWNRFLATDLKGVSPYNKLVKVVSNATNGATLRIAGVCGASVLFSKQAGDMIEEGLYDYYRNVNKLWGQFQNNIADKGGFVEYNPMNKYGDQKDIPSSVISNPACEPVMNKNKGPNAR